MTTDQLECFDPFDPLENKPHADPEIQLQATKNSIKGILSSYVGWYDPFCETIQNSMDAVEQRIKNEDNENYIPKIWITIDLAQNLLMVTDNGCGLDSSQFKSFLTPFFSYKSDSNRGHKGVGATYLAYGFNDIQLCTKTERFAAVGRMLNAKNWLDDKNPQSRPTVVQDKEPPRDPNFREEVDNGASICIQFDKKTFPKDLSWVGMDKAEAWMQVLRIKTPLGAIEPTPNLLVSLWVIAKDGSRTHIEEIEPTYLWVNETSSKSIKYLEIQDKKDKLHEKGRNNEDLPRSFMNKQIIYGSWNYQDLLDLDQSKKIRNFLNDEDKTLVKEYQIYIYGAYVWSVNHWSTFHKKLEYRQQKARILYGGIQLAANNMPQGERISIPLNNNISRQNNSHFLIHFSNYTPDLGRKNYRKEIVELSQKIASRLVEFLFKYHKCLRPATGARLRDELSRQQRIDEWKKEMEEYEKNNPLSLSHPEFFLPMKRIPITSNPSREQDVVALFNQLVAGGVIRGIQVMATSEWQDYDGLYRIVIEDNECHMYDPEKNPLGIVEEEIEVYLEKSQLPFISAPKVLEYKYSLDGLIENIETGIKNVKDINLVVVWEAGEEWKKNYKISTTLHEDYADYRKYHGVTHILYDMNTQSQIMEMIVLEDLIGYLNDPLKTQEIQINKYEEEV